MPAADLDSRDATLTCSFDLSGSCIGPTPIWTDLDRSDTISSCDWAPQVGLPPFKGPWLRAVTPGAGAPGMLRPPKLRGFKQS